jgi:hypothetical protein
MEPLHILLLGIDIDRSIYFSAKRIRNNLFNKNLDNNDAKMDFIQSLITRLIKVFKIRLIQNLGAIRLPTSSNTSLYFFARRIRNNLLNKNLENNDAKINSYKV